MDTSVVHDLLVEGGCVCLEHEDRIARVFYDPTKKREYWIAFTCIIDGVRTTFGEMYGLKGLGDALSIASTYAKFGGIMLNGCDGRFHQCLSNIAALKYDKKMLERLK